MCEVSDIDKVWYLCPICKQKLLKINKKALIEGVYTKCKKCGHEVEIKN